MLKRLRLKKKTINNLLNAEVQQPMRQAMKQDVNEYMRYCNTECYHQLTSLGVTMA